MPMACCWCGNQKLTVYGQGYLHCPACQTLVAEGSGDQPNPRVQNDSTDFYGQNYWFEHQTAELGLKDLPTRARTDLPLRCVHWLRSLLGFKIPPAKVLELGCAHGGFVAMLRQAGFDAIGLELSPAIVEYAEKTFAIQMLTGPIEDQKIPDSSLDAIVLMDVMEHLPKPVQTFKRCLELLKPDGILLIQTPCYPAGKTLGQLEAQAHQFPRMLDRNEHLFLFSEESAKKLFEQLGATHVQFIPAIFAFYDMSFVVSRATLLPMSQEQQVAALQKTTSGRFMQALLDLDDQRLALLEKYRTLKKTTNSDSAK